MSDSVSFPGAGGTGGKRGQEVTVQPGPAGTALGRQRGGLGWGCRGHLCGGGFKPAKPLRPQSALMKCFDKI